jgi:hypothetical protein
MKTWVMEQMGPDIFAAQQWIATATSQLSRPPHPFRTQLQHGVWVRRNCELCRKYNRDVPTGCEIDLALLNEQMGITKTSPEIAARMGYAADRSVYTWDCPERETLPDGRNYSEGQ